MLGIFPALANKGPKKKMNIEEIIPEFGGLKDVCIKRRETFELNVIRHFEIGGKGQEGYE